MRLSIRLTLVAVAVVVNSLTQTASAQDAGSMDQLKRMYDDALAQLKAAQDRKNELAGQNEALTAKLQQMDAQLATANAKLQEYQRESAASSEKSFFLRSHYAAWQMFLERNPDLLAKWKLFLGDGLTVPAPAPHANDAWPLDNGDKPLG